MEIAKTVILVIIIGGGVITAPREFHEKVHSRMTHSGQGFWTKSEEKYFRILSCISSIFFYLRESMKNSTEKNDWTALRPETNFVELTTPTLWIQIPEKVWKKKRILRLAPEQQSLNFLTFSRTLAIIQEVNEKSCIFHASH